MQKYTAKAPAEIFNLGLDFTPTVASHTPNGDTSMANSVSVTVTPGDMIVSDIQVSPNNSNAVTWTVANGSVGNSTAQTYTFVVSLGFQSGAYYQRQVQISVKPAGNS